ncbi:fibronectin type III domain-containing protein [Flavobacterium aurantiibacter]|uniref:Fibronectin type-III domain-containing protein n=1 Tax=Flavobacterium aurantiibacter TaxID=2023067 RepID=A0A255ZPT8_9FLAO|nr:fibronectin type III domain-containing protein [Flavobacterium aurantiibacter]OYQ42924.1 hypothetical protein CHX27_11155 [Flavobacterium aurantiibacter]
MKKLYSALLLLISITLCAQTYTFTTFNTNNSGIASNNINDFERSASGTLWITTNNGFSRMIGNSFTNYNTSNSSIGTDMLKDVAVAGSTIWISTYGNGIIRYNGTTFTNYNTNNPNMPNNSATSIATDGSGNFWMGSASGLSRFNGTSWTTYNTSNSQLISNNVTSIAVDANNNVWIATDGMLQRFNGTTFTSITDGVSKILKVTTAGLYVSTGDGLGIIVNNDYTNIYWTNNSCLASCNVNALGIDETNKVWLGLDICGNAPGGVQNFTNCVTYSTSNSALPDNSITSINVIDSNVIWVGTLEGGLVRMNQTDGPICAAPTGLNVAQFGQSSAYLAWTSANPAPANGYIYRYSTTNNVTGATESSTSQTGAGIDQLQPNTTYYWWVASACEPITWVSGGSFTTAPLPGCTTANYGLFPAATYTPGCSGTAELIASNAWAGEYTNVNILADKQYIFSSSVATDYITITNANATVIYTSGPTPLTWTPSNISGVIRYFLHTNSNCESQNTNRIRYITCSNIVANCGAPTGLSATNITSNSSRINWSAPTTAPASYDLYIATSSTAPGANTAPNVTSAIAGIDVLSGLAASTIYYFWIRSNCGASKSAWVSGGSFTTNAALNCNGASNGLFPEAIFTPACTGNFETIVTNAYGGEYTHVSVVANKQYTFSSSVATDYITITNLAGTVALASGTTPVIWNSGSTSGVIRYFLHSQNCGSETVPRVRSIKCIDAQTTACPPPSAVIGQNITSNSFLIKWTAPVNEPTIYEVYVSASSTAPTATTTATVSTNNILTTFENAQPATTYYFWVRSNCNINKSNWIAGGSVTTLNALSCNGALYGLFPNETYTPACTGVNEQIVTNAWAGEYTNVNVTANKQYTFSSSVTTDFITITNTAGTIVYASGQTPVSWSSGNLTGIIRYYIHTNANCGNQPTSRTRFISCTNPVVVNCGMPGTPVVSNITSNSCRIAWTAPDVAPSNYEVYISTSSAWPEFNANPVASPMSAILNYYSFLDASTTYYYWVRSVCGTSQSDWSLGGSFTTLASLICNSAYFGLYPEDTIVLQNSGAIEPVAYQSYAGQYSNVTLGANKQYQFTSSVATDFITITNQAGTIVLASGQTPLNYATGNSVVNVRYYLHANTTCDPDDMPRDKFAKASTLGLDDSAVINRFKVYPNPTAGQFNVDTGTVIADKIEIFDHVGRIILTQLTSSTKTTLTLNGLSDGVYLIKIYSQDKTAVEKLVLKKN